LNPNGPGDLGQEESEEVYPDARRAPKNDLEVKIKVRIFEI
jgi:hypothetical protein